MIYEKKNWIKEKQKFHKQINELTSNNDELLTKLKHLKNFNGFEDEKE